MNTTNTEDNETRAATIAVAIPPRRRQWLSATILVVALIAVAMFAWVRYGGGNLASAGTRNQPKAAETVSIAVSRREDLSDFLKLSGEFLPHQEINLYARVAGYVRQMKVDVGDRVKAGEVLAVLEIPDIDNDLERAAAATERANQDVIRAKSSYDEAHLNFERLSEVLKQQPNLIAQQDIDQARMHDETLHASWIAAQSAQREARAGRDKFSAMVAYAHVTAPFAGVVTKRYADTGSLVGAGTGTGSQALVRLSQLDPLRLVLPVPESAVRKVSVGTPVDIALQSTPQSFSAKVSRMSGRVATETRTMHVEVDVPNSGLSLAPGMYATATITLETRKQAIAIPLQALQDRKESAATVLVLDKQHRIEQREITTGVETPERIEVLSGLAEGEMVVLGARGRYQPGQSAEPKLASEGASR